MGAKNGAVAVTEKVEKDKTEQKALTTFEQMEHDFREMRRRMHEMFRWPLGALTPWTAAAPAAWTPTADAYVLEGKLMVKAELPGVQAEDITVTVENGMLTITGARHTEEKTEKAKYYTWERFAGSFTRTFTLPEGVDPTAITAEYKNGVLEVTVPLPAATKAEAHKVPIKK